MYTQTLKLGFPIAIAFSAIGIIGHKNRIGKGFQQFFRLDERVVMQQNVIDIICLQRQ